MSLDIAITKIVRDTIKRFGTSMVFTRVANKDYDPATGRTAEGETSYETKGLYGVVTKRGGSKIGSESSVTIAAEGALFEPTVGDTIEFGGKRYTVDPDKQTQRVYAQGRIAIYTIAVTS